MSCGDGEPKRRPRSRLEALNEHLARFLELYGSSLQLGYLIGDAEQILDVMADFMGNNISHRKVTLGLKLLLQLGKKTRSQDTRWRRRAVERSYGRGGVAATRIHLISEDNQLGFS